MTDANLLKFSVLHPESVNFPADTNKDGFINEKNNIKYAGYIYDAETGLYYLNARFYDPETARFIQQDSYSGDILDPLSLNLYTYGHNNPISYYDPTGHSIKGIFKSVANTVKKAVKTVKTAVTVAKPVAKVVKDNAVTTVKAAAEATYQNTVVKPFETIYKASKKASQNLQSNSSTLKESGVPGRVFANFSAGILDAVENIAAGTYSFANDPLGTIKESINYFQEDPLRHNPIASVGGYYKDIAKASYANDWDTVEYKLGSGLINLAGFAAVGGKTQSAVKTRFPNGIKVNTNINLPGFNAYQFAGANGMVISSSAVSVPISASVSSATVASASGVVAGAAVGQNIVYSKTLSGQVSGGEIQQSYNGYNRYHKTGYISVNRSNNLFSKDKSTNSTQNLTEWRRSISKTELSEERRLFLGDDYVKVDYGKWRSLDGERQFRVKPDDYKGGHGIGKPTVPDTPHVHFEFLEQKGNRYRVTKNIHVPLK
jgi:RHS repeat-associated protein